MERKSVEQAEHGKRSIDTKTFPPETNQSKSWPVVRPATGRCLAGCERAAGSRVGTFEPPVFLWPALLRVSAGSEGGYRAGR